MPYTGETPIEAAQRLERASQSLEKERQFYSALCSHEPSVFASDFVLFSNVQLRMVCLGLHSYLRERAHHAFAVRPDEAAKSITDLLVDLRKHAGVAVYLSVKGVFPLALSSLRNCVENIGVLSHIWNEPDKVQYLSDTDSKPYAQAFRYTEDKKLNAELKERGVSFRFRYCAGGRELSAAYVKLSRIVHGSVTSDFPPSEELSCFYVDRTRPDHLFEQYHQMHTLLVRITVELLFCLAPAERVHSSFVDITQLMSKNLTLATKALGRVPQDLSESISLLFRPLKDIGP